MAGLDEKRIGEASTEELYEAYERRLVQEGVEAADRGDLVDATPELFARLREELRATVGKSRG